jgi:hypothetical protein
MEPILQVLPFDAKPGRNVRLCLSNQSYLTLKASLKLIRGLGRADRWRRLEANDVRGLCHGPF